MVPALLLIALVLVVIARRARKRAHVKTATNALANLTNVRPADAPRFPIVPRARNIQRGRR